MIGVFRGRGIGTTDVFAKIEVGFREQIHLFADNGSMTSLAVFMCIALHADEGGWTSLSRQQLKDEIGIKSEHAITSALKHLRGIEINGQRVFAHYRQVLAGNRWGRSAYLIFPDLDHPAPPFDNMVEFTTDEADDPADKKASDMIPACGNPTTNIKKEPYKKESAPKKQERAQPAQTDEVPQNEKRKAVETYFSKKTFLPPPKMNNAAQRRSAGTFWWSPIRSMLEQTGWSLEWTVKIMDSVIDEMRADSLTISSPKSIEKVFAARVAEIRASAAAKEKKQQSFTKTHV